MIGMRSWISAIFSLGWPGDDGGAERGRSVAALGGRQTSHRPAKASGSPSGRWMKYGCFFFWPRRLVPLIEAVGGDDAAALAEGTLEGTAGRPRSSDRALIMRLPTLASFAQNGTSPSGSGSTRRTPPSPGRRRCRWSAPRCSWAFQASVTSVTPKYLAISSGGDVETNRPHTAVTVAGSAAFGGRGLVRREHRAQSSLVPQQPHLPHARGLAPPHTRGRAAGAARRSRRPVGSSSSSSSATTGPPPGSTPSLAAARRRSWSCPTPESERDRTRPAWPPPKVRPRCRRGAPHRPRTGEVVARRARRPDYGFAF